MKIKFKIIFLAMLCFALFGWAERSEATRQNLDEVMARKARFTTNTFYTGESGSPYYFWQPETLSYTDTNFGTEIWRMAFKPGVSDNFSKEYSTQAFDYDGGKMGIWSCLPAWNAPGKRISADPNKDSGDCTRWIMNSDGSKFRVGTGRGLGYSNTGWTWMNTQPAYLFTPLLENTDPLGGKFGQVYKVAVDENNDMTRQLLFDTDDGRRKDISLKDSLTSDDKWLVLQDFVEAAWPTPNLINSMRLSFLNLSTNSIDNAWGVARGIGPVGDPYGADVGTNEIRLRGSSSAFINPGNYVYAHYHNFNPHFLWSRSGSASDGGPAYADWDGDSFGNDEIRVVDDPVASALELPHNPYDNGYLGHPAFDRWGHYAVGASYQSCNDMVYGSNPKRKIRWGNSSCPGLLILDVQNNLANPSWVDANNTNYMLGTGSSNVYNTNHQSWTGWTDMVAAVEAPSYNIFINNYKKTIQTGKDNYQANKFIASSELDVYNGNYNAYPRPAQSPDGTKVAFSTTMFHSAYAGAETDDDFTTTAYAVAYYPYPGFIRSANSSGGTVNIRADWDLVGTPRGYTKRGWPNEESNNPPPPREINKFRLWRSPDGIAWTPIKTFKHDVWDKYDFANGNWTGNDYWTVSDNPGNGAWYYGITSVETSGLESKTLSNIYTVTVNGGNNSGAQFQSYPSDPGGKSNFYTTAPGNPQNISFEHKKSPAIADGQYTLSWQAPANRDLIRYYNIYAKDGSNPTATQQNQIASVTAIYDYNFDGIFSYVDWLGNTDGNTRYLVTAVDFQGNESDINAQTDVTAPAPPSGLVVN